jgi:aminobenzoyl-glutamate utilization protein B
VQSRTKVRYLIRARNLAELNGLVARVRKIADGAALMTETSVTTKVVSAVSNLLANTPLEQAMYDNMQRLGPPQFDEADRAYAKQIQGTLSDDDIAAAFRRHGLEVDRDKALCDIIVPLDARGKGGVGSTDVGDGAGARCDLRDRHAGAFLAAHGAGQVGHRPQGPGACRQDHGGHGSGRDH